MPETTDTRPTAQPPIPTGARVRVVDGNRKGELGEVTGRGCHGSPLVKLDIFDFSQPGLTIERTTRTARPTRLEALSPALVRAHSTISLWLQLDCPVSSDPVVRAWDARGRPIVQGYIEFRLGWLALEAVEAP